MDISACETCGGTGHVRCQFCGGRGTVGSDAPVGGPAAGPARAYDDPLAGKWNAGQGGWYEFVKQGSKYALTEYGAFGKTGSGTATVAGKVVTLDLTNALLGRVTLRLRLNGNSMEGTLNVLGIPMPFVLTRG